MTASGLPAGARSAPVRRSRSRSFAEARTESAVEASLPLARQRRSRRRSWMRFGAASPDLSERAGSRALQRTRSLRPARLPADVPAAPPRISSARSATSAANARSWLAMTTAHPLSAAVRSAPATCARASSSSPRVGSSTSSTRGAAASWMAMASSRRSPVERSRGCAQRTWPPGHRARAATRTAAAVVPRCTSAERSARRHSSATVVENSRSSEASGTSATDIRRSRAVSPATSAPSMTTVPDAAGRASACEQARLARRRSAR